MNEFAKPGLANDQLPSVSATDNGKVLTVADGKWAAGNASGGTTVVANPTLAGTEADLTGLQVGDTTYKVPEGGGGGGGGVELITFTPGDTPTCSHTYAQIAAMQTAGKPLIAAVDGQLFELYFDNSNEVDAFMGYALKVSSVEAGTVSFLYYMCAQVDNAGVFVQPTGFSLEIQK